MPPLKNPRREQFAKKYAAQIVDPEAVPNLTQVYQKVYNPSMTKESAEACASRLLAVPAVKDRVLEIINKNNPVEEISEDLRALRSASTEVFHEGESIANVPNWNARAKGIEIWMRANEIGQSKLQINSDNRKQTILINSDPAALSGAIEALGSMITITRDLRDSDSADLED
jgi:hypothetical protein